MQWENQKVLVVGMARSGVAAARLLLARGAVPFLTDAKGEEELGDALAPLQGLPCQWHLGEPPESLLPLVDAVVLSPAVPITAPFVKKAMEMQLYVTGELEMAYQLSLGTMVAISGTNGKTTTTTLLGEIFKNAGRVTHVVGNIGYPYSAAALESRKEDMIVAEVSSFQLETIDTFRPRVAALLNITEDHLNRHGTMEEYIRVKARLFENQTEKDVAVLNFDDHVLQEMAAGLKSRVAWFSRATPVPMGAYVDNGKIVCSFDGEAKNICSVEDVYIPGPHNLENALAAAAMAAVMGIPAPVIRHTLRTFQGVEHRIEFVRKLNEVSYYNDSKGTNVDSTIKAVQTMRAPTVMILGGYDKHCDFTPLAREITRSPLIEQAVLMGQTADQIQAALEGQGYTRVQRVKDLKEAVVTCRALAKPGGNVLFSPACASFDMFSDYEQRGRAFKRLVNELN